MANLFAKTCGKSVKAYIWHLKIFKLTLDILQYSYNSHSGENIVNFK